MRHPQIFAWTLAAALAAAVPGARAQDSADLVFWQSIQASKNPDEFKLYLQTYPNGRFAELARIKLTELNNGPAPSPAPSPVPAAAARPATPPAPPVLDAMPDPSLTVTPPAGRVGQHFTITCVNFPELKDNAYDLIVVVPSGTPVMAPNLPREQTKVLFSEYAKNCVGSTVEVGPFAPGAYEVRWMTKLYNNETPLRLELKATAAFTIR